MEDKTYKVISVSPAEKATSCQRCGKAISWVFTLQNSDKTIRVGVDCAETITSRQFSHAKLLISKATKFARIYKQGLGLSDNNGKYFTYWSKQDAEYKKVNPYYRATGCLELKFIEKFCPEIYKEIQ